MSNEPSRAGQSAWRTNCCCCRLAVDRNDRLRMVGGALMDGDLDAQAWREWDERYADLVLGKRNWQIAAGGLRISDPSQRYGLAQRSKQVHPLRC